MNALLIVTGIIACGVIVVLYKRNLQPIDWEPKDVEKLLQSLLINHYDPDWDDFENNKVKNPQLESIRQECIKIFSIGSVYLETSNNEIGKLNSKGIKKVKELIQECCVINGIT